MLKTPSLNIQKHTVWRHSNRDDRLNTILLYDVTITLWVKKFYFSMNVNYNTYSNLSCLQNLIHLELHLRSRRWEVCCGPRSSTSVRFQLESLPTWRVEIHKWVSLLCAFFQDPVQLNLWSHQLEVSVLWTKINGNQCQVSTEMSTYLKGWNPQMSKPSVCLPLKFCTISMMGIHRYWC